MRLINESGRFVQSIVDAAIGQWRRRLSAFVSGAPSIKFQLFCHFVIYLPKVIKLVEIRQSSDIAFHSFSLETVTFSTFVFNKVVR